MAISRLDTLLSMDEELRDLGRKYSSKIEEIRPLNIQVVQLTQQIEQQKQLDEQAESEIYHRDLDARKGTYYENKESAKVEKLGNEKKSKEALLSKEVNELKKLKVDFESKNEQKKEYIKHNLEELLKELAKAAPKKRPEGHEDENQTKGSRLFDLNVELKDIKADILQAASERSKQLTDEARQNPYAKVKDKVEAADSKSPKGDRQKLTKEDLDAQKSINKALFSDTVAGPELKQKPPGKK